MNSQVEHTYKGGTRLTRRRVASPGTPVITLFLTILALAPSPLCAGSLSEQTTVLPSAAGLRVDHGGDHLPFYVPKSEQLDFDVVLDLAVIGETRVGGFKLSSGVEVYLPGLPRPGEALEEKKQTGWLRGNASGRYLGYKLAHQIEARILPQEWPSVVYSDTQGGSENRRRELKYGLKDGKFLNVYRSDTHCRGCESQEHFVKGGWFSDDHHCRKCKRSEHRQWKETMQRPIPEGSLDMLSAVFLARTMMREQREEVSFPLLDKMKVWEVVLTRDKRRLIETKAGKFNCRRILMDTRIPKNENHKESKFKGLFGIHGTLSIWLEERTGVPVQIEGLVPLGPIDLDVALQLKSFEGTPEDFLPLK